MDTIVKFYIKDKEIYSAENNDYIYFKDSMMKWLCEKNNCSIEDISTKSFDHDHDLSEMFTCEYCRYTEAYDFSKTEKDNWISYKYYGNPRRLLIQNVVPNMPPWMRETAIRVNMGCICPTCMKNLISSEEEDDE